MPDDKIKEKIKVNGISQNNMTFINPLYGSETNKLIYDIFERLYLDSLPNVDINTLFKNNSTFFMPDKLKKINYKKTNKEKIDKTPMFSIHSSSLERTLFNNQWNGCYMLEYPYSVPLHSAYQKIKN